MKKARLVGVQNPRPVAAQKKKSNVKRRGRTEDCRPAAPTYPYDRGPAQPDIGKDPKADMAKTLNIRRVNRSASDGCWEQLI